MTLAGDCSRPAAVSWVGNKGAARCVRCGKCTLQGQRAAQIVNMREKGAIAGSMQHACDAKQCLHDEMEKSMVAKEHLDEHLEGSRNTGPLLVGSEPALLRVNVGH